MVPDQHNDVIDAGGEMALCSMGDAGGGRHLGAFSDVMYPSAGGAAGGRGAPALIAIECALERVAALKSLA